MDQEATYSNERPTAEWWYKRPSLIYFFGAGDPLVAVKIGVTTVPKETDSPQASDWLNCVHRRQRQIQSSNHEPIRLLGVVCFAGGDMPARRAEREEQELHKRFADLQLFKPYTRGAEWFRPGPELLAYIEEHARALKDQLSATGAGST